MNKVIKVYLSGPMTGKDPVKVDLHFRRMARRLVEEAKRKKLKVHVISPTVLSPMKLEWDSYMQIARAILKDETVDAICLLKGWEKSAGCILELMWARAEKLTIICEPGAKRA